jgi:LmbE family N-acetylglucosaminyl deacetylase
MDWIYISPHFDDAVFSCGGLIAMQTRINQEAAIWTICAGDPSPGPLSPFAQSLHDRWQLEGNPVPKRRAEDKSACRELGAVWRHFSIPDCIYRRSPHDDFPLYASEDEVFGPIHPDEAGLVEHLGEQLLQIVPQEARIVCPLTIGGHVDHRLTRSAVEGLGVELWYYADYPYVHMAGANLAARTTGMRVEHFDIIEADLESWTQAAASYASQISSFWDDRDAMMRAIRDYYWQMQAFPLWRKI